MTRPGCLESSCCYCIWEGEAPPVNVRATKTYLPRYEKGIDGHGLVSIEPAFCSADAVLLFLLFHIPAFSSPENIVLRGCYSYLMTESMGIYLWKGPLVLTGRVAVGNLNPIDRPSCN